jgi:UDPglucose 6-dehydrogenase
LEKNKEVKKNMRISVIGLGKVGLPMVASFAAKGHTVIGVDINPQSVRLINEGKAPVFEPGLTELLQANRDNITATEDYEIAITRTDITFIIVPTPSDEDGGFSIKYVEAAAEQIGEALRKKSDSQFHLVVLTSTVLPGATEEGILPVLESYSGKRCGTDFGLCYNPEFIALGNVIDGIYNPDFVLIGESDPHSGEILADFYKTVCKNDPPIARMNIVNAELAKISVNTFVTTRLSYANMLAEICEGIPGCDVDVITSALGLDSRIGPKYLKGAVGYGGPCFPRDNVAFAYLARQLGKVATLAEATDAVNKMQVPRLIDHILSGLQEDGKVGILGLAYKPDTDVIDESQGVKLAHSLVAKGVPVVVYDPAAMDNARLVLGDSVSFAPSVEECIRQSDLTVITTPWEEFKEIPPAYLSHHSSRPIILDCWRILERQRFKDVAKYMTLGVGSL